MEKKSLKEILYEILIVIINFCIMAIVFFSLLICCFKIVYIENEVKGSSMRPTINSHEGVNGDTVFINRFADFSTNDIVVSTANWFEGGTVIKRLVASPGDMMRIEEVGNEYVLLVNGESLYTRAKTEANKRKYDQFIDCVENVNPDAYDYTANIIIDSLGNKSLLMLENQYLLMGDNWATSTDGLSGGFVTREQIIGRVDLIVDVNDNIAEKVIHYLWNGLFSFN